MELVRGLHNLRPHHLGCVLTIGKFDGVHLGHQAVLMSLITKAHSLGLTSTVMVFEPQPEEVFHPQSAPARLSRLRDKYLALEALGIERLICIKFNAEFSSQTPATFIGELLVKTLGVKFLAVGDDFKFGFKRQGDFSLLQQAGLHHGFDVVSTQSFKMENHRISSTAIRTALIKGNFFEASQMLGRAFTISGKVVHGEKKGRTIGFPTANVLLKRCKAPISGVFAVSVALGNKVFKGVANIGTRPTLNGLTSQLEVHLFNYSGSLYGQFIEVAIHHKIRDERKFDTFQDLTQQIGKDAASAQLLLA